MYLASESLTRYVGGGGEMFAALAIAAVCLTNPVSGPITNGYSPIGQYEGHWGVDYQVSAGETVSAPVSGIVTFAGPVAGMRSITIQPISGFKVSVSYLASIHVIAGGYVRTGHLIGIANGNSAHGVHLSTRIDGRYVDPIPQMGCVPTDITRALRLVTPPQPYPRTRANRNLGWNVRSDPYCPSARRRGVAEPGQSRPGSLHTGGGPMAEI